MSSHAVRSSRINMRIAPGALSLVRAAAERQQQDLSAFVLGAAMDRAREILLEDAVIRLSPDAAEQLTLALEADPTAIPQLAEYLQRSV